MLSTLKTRSPLASPLRVLRHPQFRRYWAGVTVSSLGTWTQVVAQSLLVLEISGNSPVALGWVSLASAAAFLVFALVGGSLADRLDKRRLLLLTQSLQLLIALGLGVLTLTGWVSLWQVIGLAFLGGLIASVDQPARAAFLPLLVPKDELLTATSLNAIVMNTASTLGPVLAGLLVGTLGLALGFFLNALSFLAMLWALAGLPTPPAPAQAVKRSGSEALEGLRVIRSDRVLSGVVLGYGALLLLGPSPSFMIPLFAATRLHLDGAGMGLLFGAVGTGTVLGAFLMAFLGNLPRKERWFALALLGWSLALGGFALSRSLWLSLLALLLLGVLRNFSGTLATTLMQLRSPQEARGRVMSVNTWLSGGVRPLGDFGVSLLMAALPLSGAVLLGSASVGMFGAVLALRHHRGEG
jgi:MFS family permease